ncbi:hypothetical protein GCM10010176_104720 [Nonomuraea spiralis]|nr:hypothetical protein GCM10010176_104720 [Nonomuraea spiralis]
MEGAGQLVERRFGIHIGAQLAALARPFDQGEPEGVACAIRASPRVLRAAYCSRAGLPMSSCPAAAATGSPAPSRVGLRSRLSRACG